MFDIDKLIIRNATLDDVDFIATTIIEAEKSSTDKNGIANYFELTEEEYRKYLIQMLEEEIDGCEISISSFVVGEYNNTPVASFGGWIEGNFENGMTSGLLKSNLIAFVLPKEKVLRSMDKLTIVEGLQIERELGTYQVEYSYTMPGFRGFGLIGKLLDEHVNRARAKGMKKIQLHVFDNNDIAIAVYRKRGFEIVKKYQSNNKEVLNYYPSDALLLMEKEL